jgi:hypothetical protein
MLMRFPHRVRVYHTGTLGTSPEKWARAAQPELRAKLSVLSNDEALATNALGRWEGVATHKGRVEYHEAVVQNALLADALTGQQYLVLGVHPSSRTDAQGEPEHLICALMVQRPKDTL